MDFIVSEVINQEVESASLFKTYDLGVHGLSFLVFEFAGVQAANNAPALFEDLALMLDVITVAYNGQAILSGKAQDLMRLGAIITGVSPDYNSEDQAASANASLTWVLPFGRRLFDPNEGFPQATRGSLVLQTTAAASFGSISGPKVSIHQVEIPQAKFKRFNKATLRTSTPTSTGSNDVPLPIGNYLRGVMTRHTTRYRTPNLPGTVKSWLLRVDNAERYYTGGQQFLQQMLGIKRAQPDPSTYRAAKMSDIAAAYTQFQRTNQENVNTLELMASYGYLDLDYTKDDTFSLNTKGVSDLQLRGDFNLAENVRVYPYESVDASIIPPISRQ